MKENLNAVRSIRTNSGKYVNVFDPDPDTLLIEDIAHAQSNQPRFGGHLPKFYSVAQHSYLCYCIAPEDEKYDALMHDSSEAYLLDMPKPIKIELPDYNRIEENLMNILAKKFKFIYPKSPVVEKIDHYLLEWEWNVLMLHNSENKFPLNYPPIKIMTPKQAAKAFLTAFNREMIKKDILKII